jgi:hypothetical protein
MTTSIDAGSISKVLEPVTVAVPPKNVNRIDLSTAVFLKICIATSSIKKQNQ